MQDWERATWAGQLLFVLDNRGAAGWDSEGIFTMPDGEPVRRAELVALVEAEGSWGEVVTASTTRAGSEPRP